jgi:hypothetical protein
VGPGMGIKRHLVAIRRTRARLGHLSGGGGVVVAQARVLELRRG